MFRITTLSLAGIVTAGFAYGATAPLVGDAHVAQGTPGINFGALGSVNVGGTVAPAPHKGLFQFNVTAALPAGTSAVQIGKATLLLFVNKVNTAGSIDVNAASSAWNEATVTGGSAPGLSTPVAVAVPVAASGVYLAVDATNIVKDWVSGALPNNGFIVSANAANLSASVMFDSKEGTTTSHPAVLDIVLTGGSGPAGPSGPTGPAGAPGLPGATGATGATGAALAIPFSAAVNIAQDALSVTNNGGTAIAGRGSQAASGLLGTGGDSSNASPAGVGVSGRGGAATPAAGPFAGGIGGSFGGGAGGGAGLAAAGGEANSVSAGGFGIFALGGRGSATGQAAGSGGGFTGGSAPIGSNANGGSGASAIGGSGRGTGTGGVGLFASGGNNGGPGAADAALLGGNVTVTGNLSKGGGAFKIDHPLDPRNKYLYHSFVESPDMKNIYDGVVQLSADGTATVVLPEWFEALNRDFRYQLTSIGAPGPGLHISREVSGNTFEIAGGTPGAKVSWLVTGIRKDAFAESARIPVEQDKPEAERGRYLHPEAFGVAREEGAVFAAHPELRRAIAGQPSKQ